MLIISDKRGEELLNIMKHLTSAFHFLIIDNDEQNILTYQNEIAKIGISQNEINSKSNGWEAMSYLYEKAYRNGQFPDFIIINNESPKMSGKVFAHFFADLPYHKRENCKIIVVSNNTDVNTNPFIKYSDFVVGVFPNTLLNEGKLSRTLFELLRKESVAC